MKTLYFDCFSGISGDMAVGALIDLGADFDYLASEVGKLPLTGFELRSRRVVRAHISAVKFDVEVEGDAHAHAAGGHDHPHRRAAEIMRMVRESPLAPRAKALALGVFEQLAVAEGRVHHLPPEDVEFHEVGAVDSIADVVATAVGLEALGIERCLASAVNVGGGFVQCRHGLYPVPAPAAAHLLAGAPVYSRHVEAELVTPTGAAILAATVERFGPLDGFAVDRVGYGAGARDFGVLPNCLRIFLGRETGVPDAAGAETVVVIEANIDDMRAEELAYAAERLMAAGALDVLTIPVLMKKGRPGHLLQVQAPAEGQERLVAVLFEETTTIGVRLRPMDRRVLDRELVTVETPYGRVGVKVARRAGRIVNVSPEYEDCARLAREAGLPFQRIRDAALAAHRRSTED